MKRLAVLPLALFLAACGMPQNSPSAGGGHSATVTRGTAESTVDASGTVVPASQSRLNFRVAGVFEQYEVGVGDHVKAGQELARLQAPDEDAAVTEAQANLAKAQAGLKMAQAKLDAIVSGPLPENVQQARATLATAQSKLAALQAGGRPEDVASKQAALDAQQAKLKAMQAGARAEDVAQAQANLDQAQAKLQALKAGPRAEQVSIYKTQVEQAKNALLAAQLTRDATCGLGKGGACDAATAQVNAAQNGVDLANQQLALNTAPPTATDLAQAQAAVTAAQRALDKAKTPYTQQDLQQQNDAVLQAQQAVDMAQKPYRQQDIDQAQVAVQSAQAALNLAQHPYQDTDREQAQAGVDQAQAAVQEAQSRLDTAKLNQSYKSLVAPYDGVILSEAASPGESVGPNGVAPMQTAGSSSSDATAAADPAILIASDQGTRINANVDEADISQVHVGQQVNVTFDALPDKKFTGKVSFVPTQGTTVQKVQQYVVYVTLDGSSDQLKPGMTANCSLVVKTKDNALMLPSAAIQNVDGHAVVLVVSPGGAVRQQPIEVGMTNPATTEVLSGVNEGDVVSLDRLASAAPSGGSQ